MAAQHQVVQAQRERRLREQRCGVCMQRQSRCPQGWAWAARARECCSRQLHRQLKRRRRRHHGWAADGAAGLRHAVLRKAVHMHVASVHDGSGVAAGARAGAPPRTVQHGCRVWEGGSWQWGRANEAQPLACQLKQQQRLQARSARQPAVRVGGAPSKLRVNASRRCCFCRPPAAKRSHKCTPHPRLLSCKA